MVIENIFRILSAIVTLQIANFCFISTPAAAYVVVAFLIYINKTFDMRDCMCWWVNFSIFFITTTSLKKDKCGSYTYSATWSFFFFFPWSLLLCVQFLLYSNDLGHWNHAIMIRENHVNELSQLLQSEDFWLLELQNLRCVHQLSGRYLVVQNSFQRRRLRHRPSRSSSSREPSSTACPRAATPPLPSPRPGSTSVGPCVRRCHRPPAAGRSLAARSTLHGPCQCCTCAT